MSKLDRREFFAGSAMVAAASVAAFAGGSKAAAQASNNSTPTSTRMGRLASAIDAARMPVEFDGSLFSGSGYEWLLEQGRRAQAFLVGEEHGIAENPKLAAQLFTALVPSGYRNLAVEISPPMAAAVDAALGRGRAAGHAFLSAPESRVAFFGMKEEAEFLAAARAAVPADRPMLWGLDYEVAADRYLIDQLKASRKPAAAAKALTELADASAASWAKFNETRNPQFIYSFAGDPLLVSALRTAWPGADRQSRSIMNTLEQTFAINAAWLAGKGYESNRIRSDLMRASLLDYWQKLGPRDRVFMKFGASHVVRGVNMSDVFDIGALVPELAAMRGAASFNMLVLPGPGSQTATFNPAEFTYVPGKRNQYHEGMDLFGAAVIPGKFTLFNTRPLRSIASSSDGAMPLSLWRVIHGFDAVLVMTGSTPSSNL